MSEVSTIRDFSEWKLNRNRGQVSPEIQRLVQYYKEGFGSKEKILGNARY